MFAVRQCIALQYANIKQWIQTRRLSFGCQIWCNVNVCKWLCAHINGDRHIEIATNRIFVDFLKRKNRKCFVVPTYAYAVRANSAHRANANTFRYTNLMCLYKMHEQMEETLANQPHVIYIHHFRSINASSCSGTTSRPLCCPAKENSNAIWTTPVIEVKEEKKKMRGIVCALLSANGSGLRVCVPSQ